MAYDNGDFRIRVDGVVATEQWANTWTVHRTDPGAAIQDAVDAFHAFYEDIATLAWSAECSARAAHWKQLNTAAHGDGAWTTVVGALAQKMLPPEVAVRVSLSDDLGARGGPFLAGFTVGSLDDDGHFQNAADVVTAVSDLATALAADDWQIVIDRPTLVGVSVATLVRVGEVYDVIRKRRNELPENYASAVLP